MRQGSLYLIPTTLGSDPSLCVPAGVRGAIESVEELIVESERSALRFLGLLGFAGRIEEMKFHLLTKDTPAQRRSAYLDGAAAGGTVGLMSDAGCPVIADPGAEIVRLAHERGIRVVPLVGASSVVLALMASGFDGQSFTFHGYLPEKRDARIGAILALERETRASGRTQIFIEAPHRNDHLLADIVGSCAPTTRLCVAADLTLPGELIRSAPVARWRAGPLAIGKRPAIFLLAR